MCVWLCAPQDILCWGSSLFVKEPASEGFVAWHQVRQLHLSPIGSHPPPSPGQLRSDGPEGLPRCWTLQDSYYWGIGTEQICTVWVALTEGPPARPPSCPPILRPPLSILPPPGAIAATLP